ncbi:DNA cytosine methyltransferase [Isoptericola sp. b515]|uniref:DNA cytosine methyltransferase n=1 Tax=Isoptericola sp. b515 TaxID=3064652 RepID=UPI002713A112|nr:DNA cytosine methyltransferase [Isoptericola sp. b515]MDO8147496.1 DNA cytosine methyltransferase [Isoptericola sp. b515]
MQKGGRHQLVNNAVAVSASLVDRMAARSSGDLKVIDVFAGAGGLTAGLHRGSERFRAVRAVEHDLAAAATYAENFGDVMYAGSVEDWLRDDDVPQVDVVVGGPPCQGFSLIGKRDPNDERNALWRQFVETVRRAGPRAFVMENVPTFVKSVEYQALLAELAQGGLTDYDVRTAVVDAADFGSPQRRKRAVLIGVHRDEKHPGHLDPVGGDEALTVRDAFRGIRPFVGEFDLRPGMTRFRNTWLPGSFRSSELHFTRRWSEKDQARFRSIPYGGSRRDLPRELSLRCWQDNPRSASDVMGRLVWERPSVTIRTEFYRPEKGRFVHPTAHRTITHWEAARLQGFGDDFRWVGRRADIARQIGNAVPVHLGEAIGKHLAGALS